MANNPYVNKVQTAGGVTLIDISDTTAVASDVAGGKYFYTANGAKVEGTASGGGGGAISVVDTLDVNGGTIRTITAVDISDTTATASDVAQGKYFYTADGTKTEGTASGGGGGYNIASGDLTALFDQYAEENNMLVMDITFASDQTANVTIQHSLGSVPTEAILYPKNPVDSTSGYQIGFTFNGQFAVDRNCNRTMRWFTNYPSGGFGYSVRKDLPSLIADSYRSAYNFTQSVPTSTTITIRGGTNVETKLLAGQYKLALR